MTAESTQPTQPTQSLVATQVRAGRDAALAFVVVFVLVTGLVRINVTLPWVGHLGSALVSVLFLYVPLYIAARRDEDLRDYGFRGEPVGRGLLTAGVAIAVIVPLFALGFFAFYEVACHSEFLSHLVPHNMCSHYGGLASLHMPKLALFESTPPAPSSLSAEWCVVQWLVVGLPEELFFRGFLLEKLEARFPPRRRLGAAASAKPSSCPRWRSRSFTCPRKAIRARSRRSFPASCSAGCARRPDRSWPRRSPTGAPISSLASSRSWCRDDQRTDRRTNAFVNARAKAKG